MNTPEELARQYAVYELKTWPEYFQAIKRGEKTFEIRKHDRPFKVGDKLLLKEYKLLGLNKVTQQIEGEYTGEELEVTITYILEHYPMHNNFGLEKGHCIMGFSGYTEGSRANEKAALPTDEEVKKLWYNLDPVMMQNLEQHDKRAYQDVICLLKKVSRHSQSYPKARKR